MPTDNEALDCHSRISGRVFYKPLDSGFRRNDGSVRLLCLKSMICATPGLLDLGRRLRVPRGNSDLIRVSLVLPYVPATGEGMTAQYRPGVALRSRVHGAAPLRSVDLKHDLAQGMARFDLGMGGRGVFERKCPADFYF